MAKYQRTKGHNFERKIASLFRALYPDARRGLAQTRNAGETPDVETPDYWIECKIGKRTDPKAALKQAQAATDGRIPIAVCQDDRQEPTITMRLDDFLALLHAFERIPCLMTHHDIK